MLWYQAEPGMCNAVSNKNKCKGMSMNNNLQRFGEHEPRTGERVYIHHSASIIGDVEIGADSSVWPGAVIRGDINSIRIGKRTNVQDLTLLHVSHKSPANLEGSALVIGDNVTIGHTVILHGCTVESECLIGMGSILMDNVIVKKHVFLGAGSLVPEGKVLESGYLYMGRPAKKIRALTPEEIKHFLWSAAHYVQVKNQYLNGK